MILTGLMERLVYNRFCCSLSNTKTYQRMIKARLFKREKLRSGFCDTWVTFRVRYRYTVVSASRIVFSFTSELLKILRRSKKEVHVNT